MQQQGSSAVPADVGEAAVAHTAFVRYAITRVIRHHLTDDELDDLTQDVWLTIQHRRYLDRCRAYEQTCLAEGRPYSWLSSLRVITERMAKNYLRGRHAQKRDLLVTVPIQGVGWDASSSDVESPPMPATLQVAAQQEDAALASCRLSRIRARLQEGRRVIGGVPATAVLDDAVARGWDHLDKYERRQLRRVCRAAC